MTMDQFRIQRESEEDKKKHSILGNSDFLAKNNLLGLSNSSELAKNDFKNYMNYHLDLSTAKPLNKFENYPREYSVQGTNIDYNYKNPD